MNWMEWLAATLGGCVVAMFALVLLGVGFPIAMIAAVWILGHIAYNFSEK